jgi:hypothetical protein
MQSFLCTPLCARSAVLFVCAGRFRPGLELADAVLGRAHSLELVSCAGGEGSAAAAPVSIALQDIFATLLALRTLPRREAGVQQFSQV